MPMRPIRLLHLSDLHVAKSHKPEHSTLQAIRTFVASLKPRPDVIVVSGDLANAHPSVADFGAANEFIADLRKRLGTETIFVACPGNHDYRFYGLVGLGKRSRVSFDAVFKPATAPTPIEKAGLLIYPFDSNEEGVAARGGISEKQLTNLSENLQKWPRETFPVRIALVHHHLLPVSRSEASESNVVREPLLVMRRPGVVMEALLRHGFTAVLHGHHHIASRWTIARTIGDSMQAMEVVGCGSSTGGADKNDDASIAVIDLQAGAYLRMSRYRRLAKTADFELDAGETEIDLLPPGYFAANTRAIPKLPAPSSNQESAAEIDLLPLRARRFMRVARFEADGDYVNEQRLENLTFTEPISFVRLAMGCDCGVHGEPRAKQDWSSHNIGRTAKYEAMTPPSDIKTLTASTSNALYGGFRLSSKTKKKERINLSVTSTMSNAFALTSEERHSTWKFLKLGGVIGPEWDYVAWIAEHVVDEFEMVVKFPNAIYMRDIAVRVLDDGKNEVSSDSEVSVARFASVKTAIMRVARPVFGYTYAMTWSLPTRKELEFDDPDPDAAALRASLLRNQDLAERLVRELGEHLKAWVSGNSGKASSQVGATLKSSDAQSTGGSLVGLHPEALAIGTQDLRLGLMIFDEQQGGLLTVATSEGPEYDGFRLAIGQGVGGRAFKLESPVFWIDEPGADLQIYMPNPSGKRHAAILALPIRYPLFESRDVLAVLCLSTYKKSNRLYQTCAAPDDNAVTVALALTDEVREFFAEKAR